MPARTGCRLGILEEDMAANLIKAESRRAQRVTQEGRVFFMRDGGCGTRELAYLEDLSMTGCRMISASPLRVGTGLGLSLVAFWNERDIVVELAMVRWGEGNRLGLDFLGIDTLERERLRQFFKTLVSPAVAMMFSNCSLENGSEERES